MIDEDEEGELRSVEKFAKELSESVFVGKNIEILHGKMKQKEKDEMTAKLKAEKAAQKAAKKNK